MMKSGNSNLKKTRRREGANQIKDPCLGHTRDVYKTHLHGRGVNETEKDSEYCRSLLSETLICGAGCVSCAGPDLQGVGERKLLHLPYYMSVLSGFFNAV